MSVWVHKLRLVVLDLWAEAYDLNHSGPLPLSVYYGLICCGRYTFLWTFKKQDVYGFVVLILSIDNKGYMRDVVRCQYICISYHTFFATEFFRP